MKSFGDFGRGYYTLLQTQRGRLTLCAWVCVVAGAVLAIVALRVAFFGAPHESSRWVFAVVGLVFGSLAFGAARNRSPR